MLNHGIQKYKYKKCIFILLTLYIYGIHFEKKIGVTNSTVYLFYIYYFKEKTQALTKRNDCLVVNDLYQTNFP